MPPGQFLKLSALRELLLIGLVALVAGCAEQNAGGAPKGGGALALKMEDVQSALALAGDGQTRYEAEQTKRNGYEYCSLSIEASHRGQLRRAVELATMALYLGRRSQDHGLMSQAARALALALGFAGKLETSTTFARMALEGPDALVEVIGRARGAERLFVRLERVAGLASPQQHVAEAPVGLRLQRAIRPPASGEAREERARLP